MEKKVYNTGETEEELKAEYNYEGSNLRKAQDRMLELLIFLDKVCTENDIDYLNSLQYYLMNYEDILNNKIIKKIKKKSIIEF